MKVKFQMHPCVEMEVEVDKVQHKQSTQHLCNSKISGKAGISIQKNVVEATMTDGREIY